MNTAPNIELQSVKIVDTSSNWDALSEEELNDLKLSFGVNTKEEIDAIFSTINFDEVNYRGLQKFAKLKGLKANADQDALRLLLKNIQTNRPVDETHYRKDEREPRKAKMAAGGAVILILIIIVIWALNS